MGIDVRAFSSDLPKHWFPGNSLTANRKTVEKTALRWAESLHLGSLFQLRSISQSAFEIEIVPTADPIRLDFEGNKLVVSFRSSNCGPGYHATAVEFLDALGKALSVTWQWVASNGEALDETGFATTRRFSNLQNTMATFLRQLCESIPFPEDSAGDSSQGLAFCVPHGLGHLPGKVACPLGFNSISWVSDILEMDGEKLLGAAAGFFVWWEEGLTARTWAQLLRAQLWQNAEWRPAHSEADLLVRDQIRHSYAQATAGGEKLAEDLEQAYLQYLRFQSESDAPEEEGIGYRKYLVCAQQYASWAMSMPGYLVGNDSGDNPSFEHPALWLGMTSFAVVSKSGEPKPFEWSEGYDGPLTDIRPGLQFRKSGRKDDDGTFTQHAIICSTRPNGHKLLILTLSSGLDWPFNAFDRWIMTVSCPDLPDAARTLPTTLH